MAAPSLGSTGQKGWFHPQVTIELGWGWGQDSALGGWPGLLGAANWGARDPQGDAVSPSQPHLRGSAIWLQGKVESPATRLQLWGFCWRRQQGQILSLPGTRGGCKPTSPWAPSSPRWQAMKRQGSTVSGSSALAPLPGRLADRLTGEGRRQGGGIICPEKRGGGTAAAWGCLGSLGWDLQGDHPACVPGASLGLFGFICQFSS